ncbi:N amino acid transport system protein [Vanrija pseudolonga]|uniref:N amino acid transport system protein n=1 Tax=Vanrija pseudolonga TaxID=143232 RepID=A0AAF0YDP3_9TREE|nr:N amino acid transport system protein [Vanrija pseudolonga]
MTIDRDNHAAHVAEEGKYEADIKVSPVGGEHVVLHDAVFGDITEDGPNYRAVGSFGAWVLITKSDIGLGVLTLPVVFGTLGIVPGILLIIAIMVMMSYCAAIIGPFKMRHPEVYAIQDAAFIFGGKIAKEVFFVMYQIDLVLTVSGSCVSVATALNAITTHGACTAIFIAVTSVVGFTLCCLRTLSHVAFLGWVGLVSILAAVFTVAIACGVQGRPAAAPQVGPWTKEIKLFGSPSFAEGMTAVSSIVFACGATGTFFNIVSEMREPRKYVRSMVLSLSFLGVVYIVIGSVVYLYCGQYVASPALGSAGVLMKKVCYGLAIPGMLVTLAIYGHLGGKQIFVRILHGSRHLAHSTPTHWFTWFGCQAAVAVVGYLLASAIPNFGPITSLIGSVSKPSTCIIPFTFMWWHDNWRMAKPEQRKEPRRRIMAVCNIFCLAVGIFLTVAGTYGSIVAILAASSKAGPWSCRDNSNSVHQD